MVSKERCPRCSGAKMEKIQLPDGRVEFRPCVECHGAGFRVRMKSLHAA